MKIAFIIQLVLVFYTPIIFSQKETITYSGVKYYTEINENKDRLVLNGIGIREKYFFDLYVCGLYLENKTKDENEIIQSDEPMVISIRIISTKVNKSVFLEAVNEGFKKSNYGKVSKDQILKFCNSFKEEFKLGDKIQLRYHPQNGLVIERNGDEIGIIRGLDFKKALFGIWLGSQPADSNLKSKLLGK
jgi:hypothetical protein